MSVFDPVILSELQRLAKSMADSLAALATSVTNVGTDVGTVSGKVTTVNNAVGTVSGQVSAVNNAVATVQTTVNAINASGGTKGIKLVQRGAIILSGLVGSATISAVNVSKSELRLLGNTNALSGARIALTNSTTVSADISSQNGQIVVSWELTEWY